MSSSAKIIALRAGARQSLAQFSDAMASIALEQDTDESAALASMSLEEAMESLTRVGRDLTRLIAMAEQRQIVARNKAGGDNTVLSVQRRIIEDVQHMRNQVRERLLEIRARPTMLEVSAADYLTKERQDEAELLADLDASKAAKRKRSRRENAK